MLLIFGNITKDIRDNFRQSATSKLGIQNLLNYFTIHLKVGVIGIAKGIVIPKHVYLEGGDAEKEAEKAGN